MMKKFSWAYVKAHPVMFGIIFIVFGLFLWLVLNRNTAPQDGGSTYVQAGKDPNELAAQVAMAQAGLQANAMMQQGQMQLAALQIEGQNNLALAKLQADYGVLALASDERLGTMALAAQMEQMKLDAATSKDMNRDNLAFQYNYAKLTTDASLAMMAEQSKAFTLNSFLGAIGNLKKKDQDESLQIFAGNYFGNPVSFTNPKGPALITGPMTGAGNAAAFIPPSSIN